MEYNKVQYSEFTPDRVGQWVLRADTIEEILEMKAKLFGVAQPVKPAPQPTERPEDPNFGTTQVLCKDCHGETIYREGVSRTSGKPWKGYFCKSNRDHQAFFVK